MYAFMHGKHENRYSIPVERRPDRPAQNSYCRREMDPENSDGDPGSPGKRTSEIQMVTRALYT